MTVTSSHLTPDPAGPAFSFPALQSECAEKHARLEAFLRERGFGAILLRRNENLAWITAGAISRRVLLPSETGISALLIRRDGERFLLATNNEAARLMDEDLAALPYQPVITPWFEPAMPQSLLQLAGADRIASDILTPGRPLRRPRQPSCAAYLFRNHTLSLAWSPYRGSRGHRTRRACAGCLRARDGGPRLLPASPPRH